jgi:hypothetical protein
MPRRASEVESGPEGSNGVDLSEDKRLAWINSCTGYELQTSDGYLHVRLLAAVYTYMCLFSTSHGNRDAGRADLQRSEGHHRGESHETFLRRCLAATRYVSCLMRARRERARCEADASKCRSGRGFWADSSSGRLACCRARVRQRVAIEQIHSLGQFTCCDAAT